MVKGSTDAQWHRFGLHNEVWELSSFILLMKRGRFLYILRIILRYLVCLRYLPTRVIDDTFRLSKCVQIARLYLEVLPLSLCKF